MKLIEIGHRTIKQSIVHLQDGLGQDWYLLVTRTEGETIKVEPTGLSIQEFEGISPIQRNELCIHAINLSK